MKNGDLLVQTTLCHREYDANGKQTLQVGFKPYPGSVFVSLMLGGTTKKAASNFDAVAALNRLGWYGLEDHELKWVTDALERSATQLARDQPVDHLLALSARLKEACHAPA